MFVPETQLDAHERSDDEMSIDDTATHFPSVRVTQLDSDGCDALEQLLDGVYVVRDGASVRSASQRGCFEAVRTSSLKSFCASILKSAGRSNKAVFVAANQCALQDRSYSTSRRSFSITCTGNLSNKTVR